MRIVWTRPWTAAVCFVCFLAALPATSWANSSHAPFPATAAQAPQAGGAAPASSGAAPLVATESAQLTPEPPPEPQPRPRRLARGLLEMGAFISYSASNYWRKYASFIEDWQFRLTWRDQTRKWFTHEGLRLDSNSFRLNWTHAAAGALYYSFGRTNGLGSAASFLFSTGGSLLWEYGAEWREISSINDHVFTAVGAVPIGESLFQVSTHFRNRPGVANRLASIATNPFVAFNDLLDGKRRSARVPIDTWHDFRLSTGGIQGVSLADRRARTQTVLNLDLRVVTLPDYGAVGTGNGRASGTIDSGFRLDLSALGGKVEEFGIAARTTLLGRWWKDVRLDDRGLRHGRDLWFGFQTAWDLYQRARVAPYDGDDQGAKDRWLSREQPTRFTDKLSSVHFPGPAVSLTSYAGRLRTRVDFSAALNFSLINSLAYNTYSANADTWGVKTTLHNWGFYYAIGTTLNARAEAEIGAWRATAGVDYRRFGSIQGLDRFQHLITDDGRLTDSRTWWTASLTTHVPRTPMFASVKADRIDRRGWFHDTAARTSETRFSYEIGVRF